MVRATYERQYAKLRNTCVLRRRGLKEGGSGKAEGGRKKRIAKTFTFPLRPQTLRSS